MRSLTANSRSTITLPSFFNYNMVLKRQKPVRIWDYSSSKRLFAIELVSNDPVTSPVMVLYDWAGSPVKSNGADLYNSEEFPATPFRDDNLGGMTKNIK